MKNKIFNGKLYLEGLRQTRLMGITLAIITILISAISPLSDLITDLTHPFGSFGDFWTIDMHFFSPFLAIFMFLGPILLTLQVFGFLNKRNGSDFYHAIPCTRTCLLFSFTTSVITWLAGTILTTLLLNGVIYLLNPSCIFTWYTIPYCFFFYFIGALLVTAVMLLAKTLTGTGFSNVVVAVLILYFPRLLLYAFDYILVGMTPIIDKGSLGIFTDYSYNIPVNLSIGIFDNPQNIRPDFIGGLIYTFVLALIYFSVAILLFQKRKSETAQLSASGKWMQHVFRCLITIPITLLFVANLTEFTLGLVEWLVFIVITLLVYLGYELITTKKAKNLLKALPVFPAIIVFDVLFYLALILTQNMILGNVPDVTQIESVSIQFEDVSYYESHYNLVSLKEYFLDDAELEKMVADALGETVKSVKNGTYSRKLYQSEQYYQYPVSIKQKNGTILRRNVLFTFDKVGYGMEMYQKEEAYQEKLVVLPEKDTISEIVVSSVYLTPEEQIELLDIFSKEYNALTNEEKKVVNGVEETTMIGEEAWINIDVYGFIKREGYEATYQIKKNQFPNTYTWCLEVLNRSFKQEMDTFWKKVNHGINANYGYEIYFGSADDISGSSYKCFVGNKEANYWYQEGMEYFSQLPEELQLIKNAMERPVTATEPVFKLTIRKNIQEDDFSYMESNACAYFNLTEEEYEILKEYLPK